MNRLEQKATALVLEQAERERSQRMVTMAQAGEEKLPYLTPGGDLVIPFDGDPKYHYWKPGGQPLAQTRREVETSNIQHRTSNIEGGETHAVTI